MDAAVWSLIPGFVMNIRLKFEKYGDMRFLGHLDFMRYFQRSLRRANLPLAFSKGFHPHPILSFAQPLSVGYTSSGDYLDLGLCEDVEVDIVISTINSALSHGVRVSAGEILPENYKKSMSLVAYSDFIIYFSDNEGNLISGNDDSVKSAIDVLLEKKEIIFTRTRKGKEVTKDIRQLIHKISEDNGLIRAFISSGSDNNLSPRDLGGMILNEAGIGREAIVGVHRVDTYSETGAIIPTEVTNMATEAIFRRYYG